MQVQCIEWKFYLFYNLFFYICMLEDKDDADLFVDMTMSIMTSCLLSSLPAQ